MADNKESVLDKAEQLARRVLERLGSTVDSKLGSRGDEALSHREVSTLTARIEREPESVAAAIRALVKAQRALREDPTRATAVGKRLFPPAEADLIAELIRRDLPYYDPVISEDVVARLNRFSQGVGLLSAPAPYEQVVATRFSHLWKE